MPRIRVGIVTCRKSSNINAVGSVGERRMIELRLIKAQAAFPQRYIVARRDYQAVKEFYIKDGSGRLSSLVTRMSSGLGVRLDDGCWWATMTATLFNFTGSR